MLTHLSVRGILPYIITMYRGLNLQKHQEIVRFELYYTFLSQRGTKSISKGGVLDDPLHVNDSGNCLSVTTQLGNQPPEVNVVDNLLHRQEPGRHPS